MKFYISGKITGENCDDAIIKFDDAAIRLKELGFETVNPMEVNLGENASWEAYMRADIKLLCDCDAIFMLKDWRDSRGAKLERLIAKNLGLIIMYQ